MSVSKKRRFEIFKRDGFLCRYCGKKPPDTILELDHIVPRSEGGGDTPENLVTSCFECNRGKGATSLADKLPNIDEDEMLAAAQEMLERKVALETSIAASLASEEAELEAITLIGDWWEEYTLRERRWLDPASLRNFLQRLPMEKIREAINITASCARGGNRRQTRYFYKVCWNMIRDAEDAEVPS